MTASVVFDSSAVLAFMRREPGWELMLPHLGQAAMSAVNVQEVVKVLLLRGLEIGLIRELVSDLRLDIRPHGEGDAFSAGELIHATAKFGSGLGDRSCIALAIKLGVPALTTNGAWANLDIPGLDVQLVR